MSNVVAVKETEVKEAEAKAAAKDATREAAKIETTRDTSKPEDKIHEAHTPPGAKPGPPLPAPELVNAPDEPVVSTGSRDLVLDAQVTSDELGTLADKGKPYMVEAEVKKILGRMRFGTGVAVNPDLVRWVQKRSNGLLVCVDSQVYGVRTAGPALPRL